MRFYDLASFNWFWLVPIMVAVYVVLGGRARRRIAKALGGRIAPILTSSVSDPKRRLKFFLDILIVTCLVLTLARPQFGFNEQKEKSEGLEIALVVDVSPSMLAEDAKPSRLEMAKTQLGRLVDSIAGSKIGVVGLSGASMLLSPLTNDTSALHMYIESLTAKTVSTEGTDFRRGFEVAMEALERGGIVEDEEATGSGATRIILIASDGENHEDGVKEAAQKAARKGIKIFTFLFGTEKGAPIPLRDERGFLTGYKRDKSGTNIITQMRPALMQELANIGQGGSYFATYDEAGLKSLIADLNKLEKGEFDTQVVRNYDEKYQIPLIIAIILSLIELVTGLRRKQGIIWKGRFEIAS